MNEPYRIRPSMLSTLIKCAFSAEMRRDHPDESGEAAEYGTAAHWFSEQQLVGTPAQVGDVAPNGVAIDDAIRVGTFDYISSCQRKMRLYHGIETRLEMPQLLAGMYGHVDFFAVDYENKVIYIDDLKFGRIAVEEYENYQLLAYLLGVCNHIGLDGFTELGWRAELTIHQPRAWHEMGKTRTWQLKVTDARGYWNQIVHAIEKALADKKAAVTGRHCIYCPGRHGCNAYQRSSENAIQLSTQGLFLQHETEVLESQFLELEAAEKVCKNRKEALQDELIHRIKNGAITTKVAYTQGLGNREWSAPEKEVIMLGKLMKVNVVETKLLSPAKVEEAGVSSEIVNGYTTRHPTKARLKPKVGLSLAQKVFQNGAY